eukprot:1174769-Pleurochrysis_carterae.AAC.1
MQIQADESAKNRACKKTSKRAYDLGSLRIALRLASRADRRGLSAKARCAALRSHATRSDAMRLGKAHPRLLRYYYSTA